MNFKMIFQITGRVLKIQAYLMLLPVAVAVIYRERSGYAFLGVILFSLLLGHLLTRFCRPASGAFYARDGCLVVSLAWLALSLLGAIPFTLSGEIPSFMDAFFETVSGFTTTGASILTNVEALSHCMLFWRSFTHWIGGMGILVFTLMFGSKVNDNSLHILKAEMPGPVVEKLVPRARDTATTLYLIYIAMTVLQLILMAAGGMPLFDCLIHAFGTAGTGGFGLKADSIASYTPYLQWVITVFMLLFGVNFNIYFFLLRRKFKNALCSQELLTYLGIVLLSTAVITWKILPIYQSAADSARHSAFQVAYIMTTTGFATVDFDQWPAITKGILLLLMFIGACAGSTGGGLKVSRAVILAKSAWAELGRAIRPRSVRAVYMDGKRVPDETVGKIERYFAIYMLLFTLIFLLLCLDAPDLETALSATAACFNNIGPGFSQVGPAANYAAFTDASKLLLSFAMLLGRLEIYPMLIFLSLPTWKLRH